MDRQQAARAAQTAAAMSGAVDLSGLAAKAQRPPTPAPSAGAPAAGGPVAAPGGAVVDVTEANFEADVILRSQQQLVLVALWADGPNRLFR